MSARMLPGSLLRRFYRVEGLAAARYREALAEIGVDPTELASFHVDRAGYSPEIALERNDPFYLGKSRLEPRAIVVAVEQLSAPLVHPSLGFAAAAFRELTRDARSAIATLTLHDALIAEVDHGSHPVAHPRELAELSHFEIRFRTPRGLVASTRRLEEMKREFLASDRLWLDEDFIAELAELARRVRDVGRLPAALHGSSHPGLPCFCAAFGGTYVFEEGARNVTYLLCGETPPTREAGSSIRARQLHEHPLDASTVLPLLTEHRVLRFDPSALRSDPALIEGTLHWLAVDHLLSRDPERPFDELAPLRVTREMAREAEVPADYRELAEVHRCLASRGVFELSKLSPLTQLRLHVASSRRPGIRRFVSHLQAFLDPVHLERWWRDAPDVFFARLHDLSPARRRHFATWLERTGAG